MSTSSPGASMYPENDATSMFAGGADNYAWG